jgi:hypothetical protein
MPALDHPSEAMLSAVLNEALPPEQVERILAHVDNCAQCDRRQEQLEPAIAEYRRFRRRIEPQLPRPTRPWADIWAEMERMDRPTKLQVVATARPARKRSVLIPAWASAIAAGILIAALMLWPRGDSLLRAETLLRKASLAASHSTTRTKSRLRVRTRTTSYIRPAVLVNGSGPDGLDTVRSHFIAAHYDWSDPLNPDAFGNWRNSLANKIDRVAVTARETNGEPKEYTVDTSTPESGLREAALTVEAKNLLPVSGKFQFADSEWVEIAAVPDAPEAAVPPAPVPSVEPAPAPAPPVTARPRLSAAELAEREIEVRAAIDRTRADAGEPVGIETESGNVVVTIYNLAPQQEGQLRASLEGMDGVIVRSADRGPVSGQDTSPSGQAAAAAPFPAIDTSEAILSRAHLVEQLATRFPPEVEATLSADGHATLHAMRARHLAALSRDIDTLSAQLAGTRPLSSYPDAPVQDAASPPTPAALTKAAAAVHRLVTAVYAGGAGPADAASIWPELAAGLSKLRYLAGQQSQ